MSLDTSLRSEGEQPRRERGRFAPVVGSLRSGRVVTLRLLPEHVAELDRRAEEHGGNRSQAVRAWLEGPASS